MNKTVKTLWIEALRGKRFKQGRDYLRDKDTYCCLGVLCELAVDAGVILRFGDSHTPGGEAEYGTLRDTSAVVLPRAVALWAGLEASNPVVRIPGFSKDGTKHSYAPWSLSDLNDHGRTFDEIATFIEEQL